MDSFHATVSWSPAGKPFDYKSYERSHSIRFGSGTTILGSAAPAFLGNAAQINPEELLVGSASACHMLTFLAMASKKGHGVLCYEDNAEGFLEKNAGGKLFVSRIVLRPKVTFAPGQAPDQTGLDHLHSRAHEDCFIANSILSQVTVAAT